MNYGQFCGELALEGIHLAADGGEGGSETVDVHFSCRMRSLAQSVSCFDVFRLEMCHEACKGATVSNFGLRACTEVLGPWISVPTLALAGVTGVWIPAFAGMTVGRGGGGGVGVGEALGCADATERPCR